MRKLRVTHDLPLGYRLRKNNAGYAECQICKKQFEYDEYCVAKTLKTMYVSLSWKAHITCFLKELPKFKKELNKGIKKIITREI